MTHTSKMFREELALLEDEKLPPQAVICLHME